MTTPLQTTAAQQLLSAQRAYFQTGATLPYGKRRAALDSLYRGILRHKARLLDALAADLGKSETEAYMCEVGLALSDISYCRRHLRRWMRPQRRSTPLANFPARSRVVNAPYGVALVIAPWNYPLLLALSPLVGALAAGNCCIIKPSELSPATAEAVTELIRETFPPELVTVANGAAEQCQALLSLNFDYIFYTGGAAVGRIVMEKSAKHLTPVTLELGGKSPAVVTQSANLRLAARRILFGKFLNAGQTCVAPDYILCEKSVHQPLVQLLLEELEQLYGRNPIESPDYGRIVNRRHFDRLCGLIDPDKTIAGGTFLPDQLRIAPTIMDHVGPTDPIMQDEIFGPILPILTVNSAEEAFHFIQVRPHPLALYLFTENDSEKERFMTGLQFGGGCINDTISHLAAHNLPFGGVGASGMGAYHGKDSFLTFSHPKSIVERRTWLDIPLRYPPYIGWKKEMIEKYLR